MADGVSDDGNGGEPLVLATPADCTDATSFEDATDEEVEVFEREQKILAKIICTPGVKTFVVDIVKQMFTIIKDIDSDASITSSPGMIIKSTKDFHKGKKFPEAFKPVLQSIDTKSVNMIFNFTTSPSFLQTIKRLHPGLLDFHRAKNMYLDESFSGSDNEEHIGYFFGFQADKDHFFNGLTDDIPKLLSI